ncbi:GNAT family N-acetyltransferase [Algoriphagus hitonicola]|uniref:Ribosomal protein S18 acetylase RimI n=1 Tax=Algoriphagus hitonicola TaxID=435880 RepID=A0A1I2WI45_9BACT|nr:GNAT family N-acetyltransferase [Algoriphagus hitonicola]SFH01023.1 Ribosomal protein S18 acetylase RimI [Algoriphagus hitonicola]
MKSKINPSLILFLSPHFLHFYLMISLSKAVTLIPIRDSDSEDLFQLMNRIYKDAYTEFWEDGGDWYVDLIYNKENVLKELARKRTHYFFVEWMGEKVGILKYDYPFSPREIDIPNAMKLHRLYLDPSTHGKGIAKSLLEHCEQVAQGEKLDFIWLEAMSCKPQAKRFYEKNGFEQVLTYTLAFEKLLPQYREIEIMRKPI